MGDQSQTTDYAEWRNELWNEFAFRNLFRDDDEEEVGCSIADAVEEANTQTLGENPRAKY